MIRKSCKQRFKRVFAFFAVIAGFTCTAMAAGITGSVSTGVVSKYLWRGQLLADGPAIQPGLTLSFGKFTFGYWGSCHGFPDNAQYSESDYTISYTENLPYADFLSLKSGFTAYTFPYLTPALNNSLEVFTGLSASTFLSPYMCFYYDAVQGKGGYLEGGITHSLSSGDFGVSAALTAGYNYGQWLYSPSFTALSLNLGASYTTGYFVISPAIYCQLALDRQYKSEAAGSLSITYNFSL